MEIGTLILTFIFVSGRSAMVSLEIVFSVRQSRQSLLFKVSYQQMLNKRLAAFGWLSRDELNSVGLNPFCFYTIFKTLFYLL